MQEYHTPARPAKKGGLTHKGGSARRDVIQIDSIASATAAWITAQAFRSKPS